MADVIVSSTSLYQNGTIINYSDGRQKLVRDKIVYTGTLNDTYHLVTQNDTLDGLADKYYADVVPDRDASKLWWVIADVNNIINPLDISSYIGTRLLIPDYYQLQLVL